MVIEVSEFYRNRGIKKAYMVTNKEPRRIVVLVDQNNNKTSISYAKYLYTSYYRREVAKGDHVDHINGDKMDDRIENLQVISATYNIQKDHRHKEMVLLVCPVCGEEFLFPKRNLSTHPNPCCSRKCGGKKSHWT